MVQQVTVFGANGDSGREICLQLVARGLTVVGAVRNPDSIKGLYGVRPQKYSLDDERTVLEAMRGSSLVVSALGSGGLGSARKPTTLYSRSTRLFRSAMRECGIKRLIVLSSGGVEEEKDAPWIYTAIIRRLLMNTYLDMLRMETILEESPDLEWTSVRLPQLVKTNSKKYLVGEYPLPKNSYKINYTDVGDFVANEVANANFVRKFASIGYP